MAFKFVVFFAVLACARAGYLGAPVASYAAAPALAYTAAAPTLGSTFHGSYAAPALAAPVAYHAPAALVTPAITSQSSNILRSFGNLGQVSTYSKTIDTPFSSVRKADIRVSNPGVRIAAAAPALAVAAAPAISTYHGHYAAPAIAAPAYGAYAAPAYRTAIAAPALHTAAIAAPAAVGVAYSPAAAVSHLTYASTYANYGW